MHLTLFVPDLLWPDLMHDSAFDFPGSGTLARVLALADVFQLPLGKIDAWETRLAGLFGFTHEDADRPLPLAALRNLGNGLSADGLMLCTDPINLNFMHQVMVLSPIAADSLNESDVTALLQSLNEEFTGEGHFSACPNADNAGQWSFAPQSGTSDLPNLTPCSRLSGRRIDADETRAMLDRHGLVWINRIQMCLSQHPVNQRREAAGLPLINSLWPWGLGKWESDHTPPAQFAAAYGESALLKGLCASTQTPRLDAGARFTPGTGHHLVTDLTSNHAVSLDDLSAWQSAIAQLVTAWIAPALASLSDSRGELQSLTLISTDPVTERCWRLDRSNRALRGNILQRWLGIAPTPPELSRLVRSWSI